MKKKVTPLFLEKETVNTPILSLQHISKANDTIIDNFVITQNSALMLPATFALGKFNVWQMSFTCFLKNLILNDPRLIDAGIEYKVDYINNKLAHIITLPSDEWAGTIRAIGQIAINFNKKLKALRARSCAELNDIDDSEFLKWFSAEYRKSELAEELLNDIIYSNRANIGDFSDVIRGAFVRHFFIYSAAIERYKETRQQKSNHFMQMLSFV